MKNMLGLVLAICQHVCNAVAVVLTVILLYRWNSARELDPTFDAFNPWWPGLILLALGAIFKLARRGVSAQAKSPANRTDA